MAPLEEHPHERGMDTIIVGRIFDEEILSLRIGNPPYDMQIQIGSHVIPLA
jgi:hypothetical protein